MRKWILFSGLLLCLLLSSCGIPNPPGEKKIKEGLPSELTTAIINNPFDGTNADVYDLEVSSVTITKRQTNEKEDKAYCAIIMGNEYYEFCKYVILSYNYYDKGGWILDNWEYEKDTDYRVLSNPFAEDSVANMLRASVLYDTVEAVSCELNHYNDYRVTYTTKVKTDTEFFMDEGLRIDEYTFDGQNWNDSTDTSAVSRLWDITGSWSYAGDPEKEIRTECTLEITNFDPNTWALTGTFQYQYPGFSASHFRWEPSGSSIDLADCKVTAEGETLTIFLDRIGTGKIVFSSPIDGETSVVASLGGAGWGGFGTHTLTRTISPAQEDLMAWEALIDQYYTASVASDLEQLREIFLHNHPGLIQNTEAVDDAADFRGKTIDSYQVVETQIFAPPVIDGVDIREEFEAGRKGLQFDTVAGVAVETAYQDQELEAAQYGFYFVKDGTGPWELLCVDRYEVF